MKWKSLLLCGIFVYIAVLLSYMVDENNKQSETVFISADLSRSGIASHPTVSGTFIQWWLAEDWTDEIWDEECRILKEAGMKYIILAPTAFSGKDEATGKEKISTIYSTQHRDFEMLKTEDGSDYPDLVDACLKSASKYGLKVFLGLNFSDDWWLKRHDEKWLENRILEGNMVAEELWNLYRTVYGDTMYGWYWCWEADDIFFKSLTLSDTRNMLANAIKAQIDYMETSGIRLHFMISPYMDWRFGTPEGYARTWEYVLANSGLKDGDVFSPQDCIGSRKLKMNNYTRWFAALRKAADVVPGLRLWANTETFDISDWTSAPLNRVIRQMRDVGSYVDDWVSFSYSHYYSPNVIMPGYHLTYVDYVNNGILEEIPPTAPSDLKAEVLNDGRVMLAWEPAYDNIGVCGYYILRNGRQIAKTQALRATSPNAVKPPASSLILEKHQFREKDIIEVQAFDFAGNVSEKAVLPSQNFRN